MVSKEGFLLKMFFDLYWNCKAGLGPEGAGTHGLLQGVEGTFASTCKAIQMYMMVICGAEATPVACITDLSYVMLFFNVRCAVYIH